MTTKIVLSHRDPLQIPLPALEQLGLLNPTPTDWIKLTYFGIGTAVYTILAACQYHFC